MRKLLLLLLSGMFLMASCGESEAEKQARVEKEIEKESAKILVVYNKAISEHQRNVEETVSSSRIFGFSNMQMEMMYGDDWQQRGWDTLRTYYKIDSLERSFRMNYGEDELNILQLKIDDNWNEKMNKS